MLKNRKKSSNQMPPDPPYFLNYTGVSEKFTTSILNHLEVPVYIFSLLLSNI